MRKGKIGWAWRKREGLRRAGVVVNRAESGDGVVAGNRRALFLLLHALPSALLFRHDAVGSHADRVTLFESARLTLSPHVQVNFTVVTIFAQILRTLALSDASPEETLAAFAGKRVVVIAGGTVTTDETKFLLRPLPWPLLITARRRDVVGVLRMTKVLNGAGGC